MTQNPIAASPRAATDSRGPAAASQRNNKSATAIPDCHNGSPDLNMILISSFDCFAPISNRNLVSNRGQILPGSDLPRDL